MNWCRTNGRIALREIDPVADAEPLGRVWCDPDVVRYTATPPLSRDELVDELCRARVDALAGPRTSYRLTVVRCADETVLGTVSLRKETPDRAQAHSLAFVPGTGGEAFSAEALDLLVGLAFEEWGIHRCWCTVDLRNTAVQRMMLALGCHQEGIARHFYRKDGEWVDVAVYGLLADEWRARPRNLTTRDMVALLRAGERRRAPAARKGATIAVQA
ncbi:GNAT family N-acetyltransferase [Streptomyces sp. NPDC090025]|uniref:GNAT family N-acetyltransferase n=1 Tax=Streptomyces sp. NPDC090025 TaxID=3365922 RepID=UPI0038370619